MGANTCRDLRAIADSSSRHKVNGVLLLVIADSDLSTVHIEKRFRCPPRRLFEALTDRREVMVSTQAPAVVEAKDGGVYSIYDGAIVGSFSGEPTQERIVLKWRMRGWAEDCTSTVELTLKARGEDGHSCGLTLNHTGIPATDKFSNGDQHRQVEAGWTRILDGVSKFLGLAIDKDDD